MAATTADAFSSALQSAEESRDVDRLVDLFTEDALISVPEKDETERGTGAIREFWNDYLARFERIRSTFSRVSEADGMGVLEWKSDATLRNGRRLEYRGVTLIDTDGGKVKRFATYYDTAVFARPGSADVS